MNVKDGILSKHSSGRFCKFLLLGILFSSFVVITYAQTIELNVDSIGIYCLSSAEDWKTFAALAETEPNINAKMTADIDLGNDQTMVGASVPFKGTFDGEGHTLKVAYYSSGEGVAPFRNVEGATIKRLHVIGTIESAYVCVGGCISYVSGETITTIRDCWSSALLTSGTGGIGNTIGGFVSNNTGILVIEDCLFDGKFAEKNRRFNAGFVANNWNTLTIRNSLNIGIYYSGGGTFYRPDVNNTATLDNVFYKNANGGTPQGTAVTEEQLMDGTVTQLLQKERIEMHWIQGENSPIPNYTEKMPINENEWQILQMVYNEYGEGNGWENTWNFTEANRLSGSVYGVGVEDGHVTDIDLSSNGLTGTFPFTLLTLPYLKTLDISGNQLAGDIGATMMAFKQKNPSMTFSIQQMNISDNAFSGNVGLFANCFANLNSLNASGNCLEDVLPMIPATVTSLDISRQTIARVVPLYLAKLSATDLATKMPTILFYDHINRTFSPNISLLGTTIDETFSMSLVYQDGLLSMPYVSEQNTYYGESGDTLNVAVLNNNGSLEGSTFRISLSFDEGDSNFDGLVNVVDLQTTLNYMFEEYTNKPYNFTASNLWKDDIINIQDAVSLINFLLDADIATANMARHAKRAHAFTESDASVFIKDGQLVINTTVPVSAFDIVISTENKCEVSPTLSDMDYTCTTKRNGNQVHLIGYSLSGAALPTGDNVIGNVSEGTLDYVMMADREAQEIKCYVGSSATTIQDIKDNAQSPIVYRIPLGARRAIGIDSAGKKTMIKDE